MPSPPTRTARLVLVADGDVAGLTAAFPVDTPWWQEAGPVVRGARRHLAIDVTLLRLLETELPVPHGGLVTYLAELDAPDQALPDLAPWPGALDEHPLRLPWARRGGPGVDLAWAERALADAGLGLAGPPEQVRSWNLSSLWRLPVDGGAAWLKHVPPFFGHEGAMLARLAGRPVPRILAHEAGRILMPEIDGDDLYDAGLPILERLVDILVGLQRDEIGRTDELLGLGLPDWRAAALTRSIEASVARTTELEAADRTALDAFVADLPARFARLAETGIPDTLVHGDFHPGNARGDTSSVVLLDWGDSGVGHPLLDQPAFLDRIPAEAVEPIRRRWSDAWRAAVPGADPERAAALVAPIAAARQAIIYHRFLDGIEPSERVYHAADPADWLRRTAALLRAEAGLPGG